MQMILQKCHVANFGMHETESMLATDTASTPREQRRNLETVVFRHMGDCMGGKKVMSIHYKCGNVAKDANIRVI